MLIEDIIRTSELVYEKKENPFIYTFILVAAVVLAYLSFTMSDNGNVAFAMTFVSIIVAVMGLKGVIWPKKHFMYKPTNEKLVRKEYYFDINRIAEVKKCMDVENPRHCIAMMDSLVQDGATSLRVIMYSTKSGSFIQSQIQKYVPYEYIPY